MEPAQIKIPTSMQAQGAHGSASATQELLPRPAPANRNARVHCGRRNIAFPDVPLPEDQVLQANRRCRRLREAVRDGNLVHGLFVRVTRIQKLF